VTVTNQSLIVIITLVASTLAGYLRKDHLPDYINAALTGLFLIIAAVSSVLVAGKFSPDLWQDATLIAGQVAFIYLGAGKVLEGFLQVKINASPPPAAATPVLVPRASVLSGAANLAPKGPSFVRPADPPSTTENDLGG
jgi:hypothetical protein